MKIIASQGRDRYLVEVEEGVEGKSIIVDARLKEASPPFPTNSILARGYWEEEYGGIQFQEVLELAKQALKAVQ